MPLPVPSKGLRIQPLGRGHVRSGFSCGYVALDEYLAKRAAQDMRRRVATVFVLIDSTDRILGYYSLSQSSVPLDSLPASSRRRLPRYDLVPVTLLGRLAVDKSRQSAGLGRWLLTDALLRASRASGEVASFAVVVQAKDESARGFYERYGFVSFPDRDFNLFLPMATIMDVFVG